MLGAIVGGGFGILLANYLNPLLALLDVNLVASGGELPVVISVWQIVLVVFFTVLLSISSTLYPSWRAAAVKPAEALRYE